MTIRPDREPMKLYPPYRADGDRFLAAFNRNHPTTTIHRFESFRSFERQAYLYSQGRTIASPVQCTHKIPVGAKTIYERRPVGKCPDHPFGAVVTNAPAGWSWHNYGVADDFVFDGNPVKPGIDWSWDGKLPWDKMGAMAMNMGLEWAGSWRSFKEFPHVQKTYGLTITEAFELHRRGGLEAVWDAFG